MKNAARVLGCAVVLGLASAGTTAAVNPPTPGLTNSEGSIDITLEVTQGIQIKGLDDIALSLDGVAAGTDLVGRDTFCVGARGFSNYTIQFDSANAATGFQLTSAAQNLNYNVAFSDVTADTETGTDVTNADGTLAQKYAPKAGYGCADETVHNAQVIVTVPSTVWETATETSYTDTLTITVSGE
ncbi:hypothetical protein [Microbulbifer sp.]|uniref:hypothetical protein n=1 Tax=Microbulbifer sp. TaxID=1908541 RepID=UPI002F93B9A9